MNVLRYFFRRLRALWRSDEIHAEIAEEMRFHIERRAEENVRRGMAPEEARREAERRFGHLGRIQEQGYDVRGAAGLEVLWQDLRYGARMLRKTPGVTVVAVLSLALGIGANTAIFSLADKVLFKKLPVEAPDRLVVVTVDRGQGFPGNPMSGRRWTFSYPEYVDNRDRNGVFDGLVCYAQRALTLNEGGQTERIQGMAVSGDYFSVMRVSPVLGRGFLPEEDKTPATHPVVVLSYRLWQRRFGADPGILGRSVNLNGHAFTVVGIVPSEFAGTVAGSVMDAYVPIMMQGKLRPDDGIDPLFGPRNREQFWFQLMGRMKAGVSQQQVVAAMNALGSQIVRASSNPDGSPRFEPKFFLEDGSQGRTYLLTDLKFPLQMLMATVGLILLIACANVANLLLARAGARQKEIAIRLATGAGRMRLVSQLLTESLLLSALGAIGGVGLAASISGVLVRFTPTSNFSTLTLDNRLDWRVLAFTLAISVLTGILFGLVPALSASRPDLIPALKDETTVFNRNVRYLNLRNLLVVGQVSLSVVVLVGAALCIRSLRNLQSVDAGFDTARVLFMSFDVGSNNYNEQRGRRFYSELLDRVRLLPGVEAASLSVIVPLGDDILAQFRPEGYVPKPGESLTSYFNYIGPDYFRLMKIPVLEGREFGQSETPTSPKAIVINETAARRFWSGRSPIGERLVLGSGEVREIVGVVKDSKYYRLNEEVRAALFIPFFQRYRGDMTLHVRTAGEPGAMLAAVRREVQSLDASLPIFNIKTLEEQKNDSLYTPRLAATVLTVFGLLALGLAAVGLYGVMAYGVNRRTREIGIRLALGAQSRDVLRWVMAEGMAIVTIGLALGLSVAVAATRLVKGFLYGVAATDPVSFVAAAALLAGVALFANYLPARRASHTDPLGALRWDK